VRLSAGRRSERLERAVHELRRPLQALLLLERPGAGRRDTEEARRGLLELAACALEELEAAVRGRAGSPPPRRVSCLELVQAALERWRAASGGELKLYWDAGAAPVEGDPAAVSRALDNLLVNAIEHGAPPVMVTGSVVCGRLRITVANRVDARARRGDGSGSHGGNGSGPEPGPPRGHGVPIVSEVARRHGGRFALYRSAQGCVAALELPLAEPLGLRAA
jgi:signal transduction histidine kinase